MRDMKSCMKVVQLKALATTTADGYSSYVDLQGYNSALFFAVFGDMGSVDGSNKITPSLVETDDTPTTAANYAAVDAADFEDISGMGFIAIDAASDESKIYGVEYRGSKRYVAVQLAVDGTISGPCTVFAVLGHAWDQPADDNTVTTGTLS